ncbi:SMI1/KNR4 family protein [Metabacillus fastidiosus]|uniref:SMI1/KNR4 family protein n=1 Tax=Metabacillus fastidiosus TaxID=1458 RepID=UPI002E24FCC9|nr:SMI1/KNR4 family protein [Metabacillus fastidiosus]
MKKFIDWAKESGWTIVFKSENQLNLESIVTRYKNIPDEYLEFLKMIKQCITPSEKTWFICEDEYNNDLDIALKWNEFELISLEAAGEDNEWKSDITLWWDKYLPIVMSVDGGYSFYAIDLTNDIGAIVHGYEPEFEEVEKVAENLDGLFELIMSNKIKL